MKNLPYLILLCFSVFFTPLFSQELKTESKNQNLYFNPHKIGLSISENKRISAAYRKHIFKKSLFRSNLNTSLNAAFVDANLRTFQLPISLTTGIETHLPVSDKFRLYYGGEAKFSTVIFDFRLNNNSISLAGLTGLNFRAGKKVSIFAETLFGVASSIVFDPRGVFSRVRSLGEINFGLLYKLGKAV